MVHATLYVLAIIGCLTITKTTHAQSSQLVSLIPFDVTVALTDASITVNRLTMTTLVKDWMNQYFLNLTALEGNVYSFDQILLDEVTSSTRRRQLAGSTQLATYKGMSIWNLDKPIPDETTVAGYELIALRAAQRELTIAFSKADAESGLGSNVVDVRATINQNIGMSGDVNSQNDGVDDGDGLDVVIIVAMTIAGLAFLLLSFALYMAWRGNRHRSEEYHSGTKVTTAVAAGDDSLKGSPPPSEVGAVPYPESVISEDISTSLTAYYKSGMTGGVLSKDRDRQQASYLNDAASVSSMESYGYSLDGYASSIGGPSLAKGRP